MMGKQFQYFFSDVKRMLGKQKLRILVIWLSPVFAGIFWYRVERSLFLLFGRAYKIVRLPLIPISYLLQAYSNLDINYAADIGPGILVLHSSVGIVISGQVIVGKSLLLTGGNIIGVSRNCSKGEFIIGDNCSLGGNAVIIGPVNIGNNIIVGAGACVVSSFNENEITLVGVPAKPIP